MDHRVLIANRGEIAVRVMQTAQRLGVKSVAVYSDADANSMHVKLADEAVPIGPAPSSESYLRMERIIAAAKATGAKAIHPGYGFLSENAAFANLCKEEGLIFIGPPASAIESMGSKSESKNIMAPSGVPVVPGYHGENQDPEFLLQQAREVGFPVLIKAVKGGGGKGMRVVMNEADFAESLDMAQACYFAEARKHFGDDRVLIERYVQRPRHVEVQVFADQHGNAVHLFERDCSLQRRHQKVIEEAPAPGLRPETRQAMGEAAVRAALAVGYEGAGTVEFIMDTVTQEFFFMEMNTRLQVEHPVTEMVTQTDLVEWQLRVASGFPLPLTQDQVPLVGHAFEARIYAENPAGNFLPGSGPLSFVRTPEATAEVRIETGVEEGDEVTVHYDPMIAKLVVWGESRDKALSKLSRCLEQYNIAGLATNISFLQRCARHPSFKQGDVSTDFIQDHHDSLLPAAEPVPAVVRRVAGALVRYFDIVTEPFLRAAGNALALEVGLGADGSFLVSEEGADTAAVIELEPSEQDPHEFAVAVDGQRSHVRAVRLEDKLHLFADGSHFELEVSKPDFLSAGADAVADNVVTAPMTGTITKVMVEAGQTVKAGQTLAVMEAMKMELVLRAPFDGVVESVTAGLGGSGRKNQPS
ncbi:uncharacterized protein MONBRDRAFT_21541 [Monosiga brevicollis MX1]|uniref:Uncharacterized protein n=1 Tax=Monosiga brevicollis TaxID=81824 RepID=A9V100_MONBE|nr:uncharacterized protein MONBRDRAFT_21541 [Monosiga brevicollis MX1]EDQ88721.1 predicted protein [Monosiga brevicollis MX1]|eukprot:XP_001746334.1 hypothetical protein [Monosiga brevicollis MX1]